MIKKQRRKKKKIEYDERLNDKIFQDEASITTPILASNLSTSISIIDIEKYQNISGTGCQKDNENIPTKIKIIYSDEENTNPSVSPKNTRLFESRRIQVDDNLMFRKKLYDNTKYQLHYYPENNEMNNRNDNRQHREQMKTEETKRKEIQERRRGEKVSYPDVNIQVISMMLPGLNESLIQQEDRKKRCNERNIEERKKAIKITHASHRDDTKQKQLRTDVDVPDLLLGQNYAVSPKEVEILWKYSQKYDKHQIDDSSESIHIEVLNKERVMKQISQNEQNKERRNGCSQTYKKNEHIYFNDREVTKLKNVNLKDQAIVQNISNVDNTDDWIPKLVQKMHNCFSYVKDILIEKPQCSSEHKQDDDSNNSISNILEEEVVGAPKNEFVTLYYKEKKAISSTNFVPNFVDVTSNNSEFSIQNPYCRNYFVYYNQNLPVFPSPISDYEISKNFCGKTFMKQRELLNQQYTCLKDVAKVILYLTGMLSRIYKEEKEAIYPSAKCFTSIFRLREIFSRVASINEPVHEKLEKRRKIPELLLHFESLKQQESTKDILKVNHSYPLCSRSLVKRKPFNLKDVDVIFISSNCVLVRWKVPKMLEMLTKGYKIFLNNVLQCQLMYFETCAVLENVDLSKPLLITIMTFTADGYCYSTKVKSTFSPK